MGTKLSQPLVFPAGPSSYDDQLPNLYYISKGNRESIPVLMIPYCHGPSKIYIIYLHGNSCDVGQMRPELSAMSCALKAHVVSPEYPGYGVYEGLPSAKGINETAQTTLNWIINEQNVDLRQIIILGRSIGSGPASELALYAQNQYKNSVGALVLHSPYKSISAVANDFAFGIGAMVVPNFWDNEKILLQLSNTPMLIVHGRMDEVIRFYHGEELFKIAPTRRKEHFWMESASHNMYSLNDLLEAIGDFLDSLDMNSAKPESLLLNNVESRQRTGRGAPLEQKREPRAKSGSRSQPHQEDVTAA
eukprot:Platyproteum_vivax@DN4582_c0_g1_i1.p1